MSENYLKPVQGVKDGGKPLVRSEAVCMGCHQPVRGKRKACKTCGNLVGDCCAAHWRPFTCRFCTGSKSRPTVKTWNIIDRETGKCLYQRVSETAPEALDGFEVREAVSRAKRPGDYSDRAQQRAEAGHGE